MECGRGSALAAGLARGCGLSGVSWSRRSSLGEFLPSVERRNGRAGMRDALPADAGGFTTDVGGCGLRLVMSPRARRAVLPGVLREMGDEGPPGPADIFRVRLLELRTPVRAK